jgi:hypothetical protein
MVHIKIIEEIKIDFVRYDFGKPFCLKLSYRKPNNSDVKEQ